MKEKQITVLMVEPGKNPVVTTIENKLEKLQEADDSSTESSEPVKLVLVYLDSLVGF